MTTNDRSSWWLSQSDVNSHCGRPSHFDLLIFSRLTLQPLTITLMPITIIACASAIDAIGPRQRRTTSRAWGLEKNENSDVRRFYQFNGYCVPHYYREMFSWKKSVVFRSLAMSFQCDHIRYRLIAFIKAFFRKNMLPFCQFHAHTMRTEMEENVNVASTKAPKPYQ